MWWLPRYDALNAYLEKNGGKYPVKGDPAGLGRWISDQREACRKGLKCLSADRIELLEKLRGWTWNAKVGKTSKTDATGIQARPKKRQLSEAGISNEAIGDASETCSAIETDLEDDDASSDSSDWDDIVIEPDSDDDAGDEGDKDDDDGEVDKDDDIEVVPEDRDEDDDHDVDASDSSDWDDIVIKLDSDDNE